MEYLDSEEDNSITHKILCCQCGIAIESNPANMCVGCLRSKVDITDGIPRQVIIYFCKGCERYLQPPNSWILAELESKELLEICLKKIKGLNKVHLVDASFIWTEPHCKRLKVNLVIQKEVMNGAILQQNVVVEFVVSGQICDNCEKVAAKDFWKASVQVRQKTGHKKTIFYLEQLILKHKLHHNCTNLKQMTDGLDFFFALDQDARKMVDFISSVLPSRYQKSQRLISHDTHDNTYNSKTSYSIEIVPICKDDIICLPIKLAQQLGGISQICIILRVAQTITLIDPTTSQLTELSGTVYWRSPFATVVPSRHLMEYVVLEIEEPTFGEQKTASQSSSNFNQCNRSSKHDLLGVWVTKANAMDAANQVFCWTHLGRHLNVGDSVLGYDFTTSNLNNPDLDKMKLDKIPDVVLVKKFYDRVDRKKRRNWKLKRLYETKDKMSTNDSNVDTGYNDFLEDLEEDNIYRQHINIYHDEKRKADVIDHSNDFPTIELNEMLDDLHLDAVPENDNKSDMDI